MQGQTRFDEEIGRLEREWIASEKAHGSSNRFSLALSGGGVRAASVARGLIDVLIKRELICQLDYVSSVSGGSYAACELIQDPVTPRNKRPSGPPYSGLAAVVWGLFEALIRIVSSAVPVAALMSIAAPYLFFPLLIASELVLAVAIVVLNNRKSKWARRALRIAFGTFIILNTLALVGKVGFIQVALGFALVLVIVRVYVVAMPHRASALNDMQHWPKMLMLSLTVAALVLFEKSFGILDRPRWCLVILAAWAVVALVYFALLMRNVNGVHPLFTYYRDKLAKAYLPVPDMLLCAAPHGSPYPILNVTGNDGSREFQMEMAPLHVGPIAGRYFPTSACKPAMRLADAMASSASALDFARHDWNLNGALSFFLGGTGYWLPVDEHRRNLGSLARVAYNMPSEQMLRVSDGGFTDNLGLLALLRRRVRRIVCLDAAYDPQFRFDDLRRLCNAAVVNDIAEVDVCGLHEFSQTLRFAQSGPRFIKLIARYGDDTTSEIWLIKLDDRRSAHRREFANYPHIPTGDQKLWDRELNELRELGERLAWEVLAEAVPTGTQTMVGDLE